jgi:RNA polymerase sigma-70 factor, ECF subfamily
MTEIEENKVIESVLAGETDDFRHLVVKYQQPVFNYVFRNVGDYDNAKDVTQQVFIKAYVKLNTFNNKYKFFSWLFRIAINETINYSKYHRRFVRIDDYKRELAHEEYKSLEKEELKERVEKSVMELSPKYRTLIILKHFEDYSYSEIAAISGLTEKKVKSRLFTAREKLSKKLGRDLLR